MRTLLLAFLSGVPALVYEIVWTREVALLAGSQVEAISVVLVAFFGGLALGARVLGAGAAVWLIPQLGQERSGSPANRSATAKTCGSSAPIS